MTDRYDQGGRLVVGRPSNTANVFIILVSIIVIVVLIVLFIYLRRTFGGNNVSGSGSTECATNFDCLGTQICDVEKGICVDCLENDDCPIDKPVCNLTTGECGECFVSGDCPSSKPICDILAHTCKECLAHSDCGGATPYCNSVSNICVNCITSANCPSGKPFCNPGNNECSECLSNGSCTAPKTCVNGTCCDVTAPIINSLTGFLGPAKITGTYTFTQNPSGALAIIQLEDSTGAVLYVYNGIPVNGSINITQVSLSGPVIFYAGYTYRIRMRISLACGISELSAPFNVTMPSSIPPVIVAANASTSTITVFTSNPGSALYGFYNAILYITQDQTLDPNRCYKQPMMTSFPNPPYLGFFGTFPIPGIVSGQQWYVMIGGKQGNDYNNISAPFSVIIP